MVRVLRHVGIECLLHLLLTLCFHPLPLSTERQYISAEILPWLSASAHSVRLNSISLCLSSATRLSCQMNICCPNTINASTLQEKVCKILSRLSPARKQVKNPTTFSFDFFWNISYTPSCTASSTLSYCHNVISWRGLSLSVSLGQVKSLELCSYTSAEAIYNLEY